jgi:ribonuclease HI
MADDRTATMNIDGGSRGNPGPAAYAVVLARNGQPPIEEAEAIGTATNNVAEYSALVRGLEISAELGVRRLAVVSDSELLVKQMNGEYRVKNPDLLDLYQEAIHLRKEFERVTFTHVRREHNKRADFLCNEALDGRPRKAGEAPPPEPVATPVAPKPPKKPVSDTAVRADALACLSAAAHAWATHGLPAAPVEQVWDQLWSILEEGGVLRKK